MVLTLGCLGNDGGTEGEDAEPNAEQDPSTDTAAEERNARQTDASTEREATPARGPIVHHLNATFPIEAANLGTSFTERSLAVDVPSDAQAIVAEVRWEGTADLDLALWSPQFCQDTLVAEPFGESVCRIAFSNSGDDEHAYTTERASPALQQARLEVRVDASTIAEPARRTGAPGRPTSTRTPPSTPASS